MLRVLADYDSNILAQYIADNLSADQINRIKTWIAKIPKMCGYCCQTRRVNKRKRLCFGCNKQIKLLSTKNSLIELAADTEDQNVKDSLAIIINDIKELEESMDEEIGRAHV